MKIDKIFGIDTNQLVELIKPTVLIVVFIATFLGLLFPKILEISQNVSQVKTIGVKIKEVKDKINYFLSIDQSELEKNSILLSGGVMPEKSAYLLVKVVGQVAAAHDFTISDFAISLGDIKDKEISKNKVDYEKIPVALTLAGPKNKYLELVAKMERTLPVLSLNSFDMKIEGEVARINLVVSAYYLPESKKINVETLSLAEVTLKKEEAALLGQIKEYQLTEMNGVGVSGQEVKKFDRNDPFFTL